MRSPYDIYESIHGKYVPDEPREIPYSVWFSHEKQEYVTTHPESKRRMIDGNFFEDELQRFFAWLDEKHSK